MLPLPTTISLPLLRKFSYVHRAGRSVKVDPRIHRPSSPLPPQTHPTTSRRRGQHTRKRIPIRGPSSGDVSFFRSVLSRPDRSVLAADDSSCRDDDDDDRRELLARYNRDWTGRYRGSSPLVLRPRNAGEVSSILGHCHDNFVGVVPQGGNTGLCGAATPLEDEVVISLEDMDAVHHLDEHSGILTCDAGCVLQNLRDYASERGRLFPLDIGSGGTCQIGGNVSTNAGGQYFFRFGGLHGTVMGLEVVLPDGRVMHLNMEVEDDGSIVKGGTHRKDNTGYDLKHLFIGAEGTLGVVTKVAVACPTLPASRNAALLVCDSYDSVLGILRAAEEELGEIMSAMELMDLNTLRFVQEHGGGDVDDGGSPLLRDMLRSVPPAEESRTSPPQLFLLVETQGSNSDHDGSKMDSFLTRLYDGDLIRDGFLSRDIKQLTEMWRIRESCNPSVARAGCVYKFDVSVPIEDYVDVAREVEGKLLLEDSSAADLAVCLWGHVADGNAHVNVVARGATEWDPALAARVEAVVYSSVRRRRGSVSAEHGLGQSKNELLGRIKEDSVMDAMAMVKASFDPHGIMNPGKYLPRDVTQGAAHS